MVIRDILRPRCSAPAHAQERHTHRPAPRWGFAPRRRVIRPLRVPVASRFHHHRAAQMVLQREHRQHHGLVVRLKACVANEHKIVVMPAAPIPIRPNIHDEGLVAVIPRFIVGYALSATQAPLPLFCRTDTVVIDAIELYATGFQNRQRAGIPLGPATVASVRLNSVLTSSTAAAKAKGSKSLLILMKCR